MEAGAFRVGAMSLTITVPTELEEDLRPSLGTETVICTSLHDSSPFDGALELSVSHSTTEEASVEAGEWPLSDVIHPMSES